MPRSAARRASGSRSSGSQPNLRDRSTTAPGTAERDAQQQLRARCEAGELAHLVRDCRRRTAVPRRRARCGCPPARLIGCVWMQRSGATPKRCDQLHLAGRGEIQTAALLHDRLDHRRMRQGLERVVQRRPRAAHGRACGTARARARSRGSAAVSRTRAPGGGCARARTDRSVAGAALRGRVSAVRRACRNRHRSRRCWSRRAAGDRAPPPTLPRRARSCTRIRWQPARSRVRRLVYSSCA